jgi:hypothetical protein
MEAKMAPRVISLVEIGPMREMVPLRDGEIEVRGVPAESIFQLLMDFPELKRVFEGKRLESEIIAELVGMGGRILASLIAAGCGFLGDEKAITSAQVNLTIGESTDILTAMMRLTFPQGARNFIDAVMGLLQSGGGAQTWAAATKSPEPSNSASPQDTPQKSSGGTPPGNSLDGVTSSQETRQGAA